MFTLRLLFFYVSGEDLKISNENMTSYINSNDGIKDWVNTCTLYTVSDKETRAKYKTRFI